ncbi:dUTPase-like protein, partial [Pterulicium gracile]
ALVDTHISIAVPSGTYRRVAPRSGLDTLLTLYRNLMFLTVIAASNFIIHTGAGVIDTDYRRKVFVLLFNLSDQDFELKEGDRVAQLILEEIHTPEVQDVHDQDLDATIRGSGGFGSTG